VTGGTELIWSEAATLVAQLRAGRLQPPDVTRSLLDHIRRVEPSLHAYVRLHDDAEAAARALGSSPNGHLLWGLPIAIKDNICIQGKPTTCASRILDGFVPPYSATVVERLRAAGAVIVGQTNMDEFAFGSSTETSCYGITRNPWDTERIPGGSSGGSAAAVAAGEAFVALGSDTGGSIRQPAALCGVTGIKPTYGRVSRYGLVAFGSSLDQIGPIARSVADVALVLQVIAGHDPKDATSADVPVPDYSRSLVDDVHGMRLGIPREYFVSGGIDPEVEAAVRAAIDQLVALGATAVPISLPHTEYAISIYYLTATAEASSNLSRFDGIQYGFRAKSKAAGKKGGDLLALYEQTRDQGFGDEAKRRILLGTYALSAGYYDAYYLKAQEVRALVKRDFEQAFQACDCIVTPTTPTAAFKIGEKMSDPLSMYLSDIYTISANLAGVPAMSLPCGMTRNGLPIGLQLSAKPFDEPALFRVGHTYQQHTDWHRHRPPLANSDTRLKTQDARRGKSSG